VADSPDQPSQTEMEDACIQAAFDKALARTSFKNVELSITRDSSFTHRSDFAHIAYISGASIGNSTIRFNGRAEKHLSEGELLFIFGHELGHLQRHDPLRHIIPKSLAERKAEEKYADIIGSAVAGCSVGPGISFFRKNSVFNLFTKAEEATMTHPSDLERVKNLMLNAEYIAEHCDEIRLSRGLADRGPNKENER